MKTIIKQITLGIGVAVTLGACSENSWNDHLDGFEDNPVYTDVQSLDYTLTDADYDRVAKNRFNVLKAKEAGESKALEAVGKNKYFTPAVPPMEYIPNLLKDSLFKYFTLTEGSAINVTYRMSGELPEIVSQLSAAQQYVVDNDDYQYVYGSKDDYAAAFTPSFPASKNLPKVLSDRFDDAQDGDVVIVNYNVSDVDATFGNVPEPPAPTFTLSSVLGTAAKGQSLDVSGVVTAVCARGFILTDATGSILVYSGSYDPTFCAVGDQMVVSAEITSYGNGLQIAYDSAEIEKKGSQAYTYPTPVDLTPAYLAEAAANTDPVIAYYGVMKGKVQLSGNYINILLDSDKVRGSVYYATDDVKAQLADGSDVTLYGYFTSTSGKAEPYNCNLVVTKIEAGKKAPKRVATVPSTNRNAVYQFEAGKWSEVSSAAVLQPSDYNAMGQSYGNLSASADPAFYLPIYLKTTFPYAQEGDAKYVLYKYYANSETTYRCDPYVFDGSAWTLNTGVKTETEQYVYGPAGWVMDPSVTVTLPAGRNQPLSTKFYQTCVDWVKDNVPDGAAYVTSYGNNEYYCGTSAYQGNVDLRPSAARTQYAGYDSMTDEEIVALMKERFAEQVMPGALSVLYPNMDVTPGVETLFTIHFAVYTGTTQEYTIVYKVVGKGKFEFVSCDW